MKQLISRLQSPRIAQSDSIRFKVSDRVAYAASHSYPYSSNGYAIRTHGIASALSKCGHSVHVISRPGRPWDLPGFDDSRFPAHVDHDNVRYLYLRKPSGIGRSQVDYITASTDAFKELFRLFKPSAVLAASNWENALPAAIAARELGLPYAYEVRGFWEISRIATDPSWKGSKEYKKEVEMETLVASQAERVFTLNRFMREELVSRGVLESKIELVPNGYGELPNSSANPKITRASIGCTTKFVVGYVGSFSAYEGLDELVRACSALRRQGLDLSLVLVGSGNSLGTAEASTQCAESERLMRLAKKSSFGQYLHLAGRVPFASVNDYYALIDLVVIPRKQIEVCDLVSPLKPLEAASYSKPTLVSSVRPLSEWCEQSHAAIPFIAGNSKDLQEKIQRLLEDEALRSELGLCGRKYIASNRQWKDVTVQVSRWVRSAGELKRAGKDARDLQVNAGPLLRRQQSGSDSNSKNYHVSEAITLPKTASPISKSLHAVLPAREKFNSQPSETQRPPRIDTLNVGGDSGEWVELSSTPTWCQLNLDEDDYAQVVAMVKYEGIAPTQRRKAVILVEYLDAGGKAIPGPYKNTARSDEVGWYKYLAPPERLGEPILALEPPRNAVAVRLGFRTFYTGATERAFVGGTLRLRWHENKAPGESTREVATNVASIPDLVLFEPNQQEKPRRLRVASILDVYSQASFKPECDLIAITPEKWREELLDQPIDLLFVESAWHGNDDSWAYRVAKYDKPKGSELSNIIRWAQKQSIPTVFWNKEDPPNFDRFIERAIEFDYIFTTDADCAERYRKRARPSSYISSLQFAAQPVLHNPTLEGARREATSFAGTYYANDYEPRRRAMDMLLRLASQYGLDIYDRMHNVTGKEKRQFEFPKDLQAYVRGSLTYDEMLKAYREYRVGLNVNSVSDSPTMFSRRVFELMACGTPVISTQSKGIEKTFGGLVATVESEERAIEALQVLMSDNYEWLCSSVRGMRHVHMMHTYRHRLAEIVQAIGMDRQFASQSGIVIALFPRGNPLAFRDSLLKQKEPPVEIVILRIPNADALTSQYCQVLQAAGFKVIALPRENAEAYMRNRHACGIVAICDGRNHYGPGYLIDARVSISDRAVDATTMCPSPTAIVPIAESQIEDIGAFGRRVSQIYSGTEVMRVGSPALGEAMWSSANGYSSTAHRVHRRAEFDFFPGEFISRLKDLAANNL